MPRYGTPARGEASEGVNTPAQYGRNIKSLCVLLNVHYRIPYKKITGLMHNLYGYQVNERHQTAKLIFMGLAGSV